MVLLARRHFSFRSREKFPQRRGWRLAAAIVLAFSPAVPGMPAAAAVPGADDGVAAAGQRPAASAPADVAATCLAAAAVGVCRLPVPADPTVPYSLPVPAGLTAITVLVAGGQGGAGDDGAIGGDAGLAVAEIPLTPGDTLQAWVATGAVGADPGAGWAPGGSGVTGSVITDSGGGGGASAVQSGSGTILAVAGGGGGAGGSYSVTTFGGNGGAAGSPATRGQDGTGVNPNGKYGTAVDGGNGGCANDTRCGGDGHPPQQVGAGGNGTHPDALDEPGGGGGAGYPQPGWGGAGAEFNVLQPLVRAAGGGGGGGQNYVVSGGTQLASGSTDRQDGYMEFRAAGQSTSVTCANGNNTAQVTPTGAIGVLAIVGGASGGTTSDPGDTGTAGAGALAIGQIAVTPGETLTLTAGCTGGGENPNPVAGFGPGGGGGGAGSGADDGGGGGGGSAVIDPNGAFLMLAGGGGGAGGYAANYVSNKPQPGGSGGNAGLGWNPSGAGAGTTGSSGAGGGGGTAPTPGGVPGEHGAHDFANPGGGGGGGGGGALGGQGGGGGSSIFIGAGGGGGGGAGASDYDVSAQSISDPHIGLSSGSPDGFVVVIPEYQSSSITIDLQLDGAAASIADPGPFGATVTCTLGTVQNFSEHVALSPGTNTVAGVVPAASTCDVSQSGADLGKAWSSTVAQTAPVNGNVLAAGNNVFTVTDRLDFVQHYSVGYQSTSSPPPSVHVQLACDLNGTPVSMGNAGFTSTGAAPPSDAVIQANDGQPVTDLHFTGLSTYDFGQPASGQGPLTGTNCYPRSLDLLNFSIYDGQTLQSTFGGVNGEDRFFTVNGINSQTSPFPPTSLVADDCSDLPSCDTVNTRNTRNTRNGANGANAATPRKPAAAAEADAPATTGSVTVTSRVIGAAAPSARPATVTLTCNRTDSRPAHRTTTTVVLPANGGSRTVRNLPIGTQCTVRQGNSGGAQHVSYAATGSRSTRPVPGATDGVLVTVDDHPQVTVTNTFDAAPLRVQLSRDGSDAGHHAQDPAHLTGRCRYADGTLVRAAKPLTTSVTRSVTVVLGNVPVGAICSASILEDDATATRLGAPVVVSPVGGTVLIRQTFDASTVSIRLAISGPGAAAAAGRAFDVVGRCVSAGRPGRPILLTPATGTLLHGTGSTTTAVRVPNGYSCGAAFAGPYPSVSSFTATPRAAVAGRGVDLLVSVVLAAAAPPTTAVTTRVVTTPVVTTPVGTTPVGTTAAGSQTTAVSTAPSTDVLPVQTTSTSATGPVLAATGVPAVGGQLAIGVLLLLAGVVVTMVAVAERRRRTRAAAERSGRHR